MAIGLLYGLSGADVILTDANADNIPEFSAATYTVWTALVGGTQLTELYSYPAQTLGTTVSGFVDGAGRPRRLGFYAASGVTATLYLRNEAATGDTRWPILPWGDLGTRVGGVTAHSALTGLTVGDDHTQYLNNTRGDVRYYTQTQVDGFAVKLTGAQTVAGVKTFSSPPAVPDGSFAISKVTGLQTALNAKLDASSSDSALANITDLAPSDGDMRRFDSASGQWLNIDPDAVFATLGPDGRLATAFNPLWFVPIVVVNEGDPVPSNFPAAGIVFSRPASATLVPVSAGVGSSAGTTSVVVATTQSFAIGDYIGFCIGSSAEQPTAPLTLPTTYTVSYATGAGAKTVAIVSQQANSAQGDIHFARVTTAIPAGTNVTITGSNSRVQLMVSLLKMINLASSAVLDQTNALQGGVSSPLSLVIGQTGATVLPNELAIGIVVSNPGTGTVSRTYAGSGGWQNVGPQVNQLSTGGGSARCLAVVFKVLAATGPVTGNVQVTSSDGTNAAWAGAVATFKAA